MRLNFRLRSARPPRTQITVRPHSLKQDRATLELIPRAHLEESLSACDNSKPCLIFLSIFPSLLHTLLVQGDLPRSTRFTSRQTRSRFASIPSAPCTYLRASSQLALCETASQSAIKPQPQQYSLCKRPPTTSISAAYIVDSRLLYPFSTTAPIHSLSTTCDLSKATAIPTTCLSQPPSLSSSTSTFLEHR